MAPSGAIVSMFTTTFICFITSVTHIHGFTETYWQSPLQLFDYQSYRSVRILEYTVPQQTTIVSWDFHGLISEEGCQERNVEVAVQHGSYPVIAPLGETFPPNFNLHRTALHVFQMRTNGTKMRFQVRNPLPGSWFAALYLIDGSDNRIQQKGFGKKCQYFVGSTQEVGVIENIPELVLRRHITMETSSTTEDLYRFHTTEQTWEYNITFTKCHFTPVNTNTTDNSTQSGCPLKVAVRGAALASGLQAEAKLTCGDEWNESGNCSLVVTAPESNTWQYLHVTSEVAGRIHFTLYIDVKECYSYGMGSRDESSQRVDEPETDFPPTNSSDFNTTYATNSSSTPSVKKAMIIPFPMLVGSLADNNVIKVLNTSNDALPPTSEKDTMSATINTTQFPDYINATQAPSLNLDDQPGEQGFKQCTRIPELGRFVRLAFDVQYSLRLGSMAFPNQLLIPSDEPLVLAFKVKALQDNGGTLKYQLGLIMEKISTSSKLAVVSCIQRGRIPLNQGGVACNQDNQLAVRTDGHQSGDLYFPYPESGTWYITMVTRCYENSTHYVPCTRREHAVIRFSLTIVACVDGGCGIYGQCREYFSGVLHFSGCACAARKPQSPSFCLKDPNSAAVKISAGLKPCVDGGCGPYGQCQTLRNGYYAMTVCSCLAHWRGYGCTDGSVAESDTLQLISTLLLSLSNLAFLPAIVLALIRKFYVEALVYTYTMFFSTFYHACDGDSRHTWCMMPYNVLAHCDFFGAILSFWVTLVSMAKLPERVRSFLLMLAALALAVGVQWDRHSLWTFLVPAGTGLVIMLISWSFRCHKRKDCYPSKRRWLIFIVPGAIIAVVGLIIFAFFETDRNYKYTHSLWHACMALCIVFILPPRRFTEAKEEMHVGGEERQGCMRGCCSLSGGSNDDQIQLNDHSLAVSNSAYDSVYTITASHDAAPGACGESGSRGSQNIKF